MKTPKSYSCPNLTDILWSKRNCNLVAEPLPNPSSLMFYPLKSAHCSISPEIPEVSQQSKSILFSFHNYFLFALSSSCFRSSSHNSMMRWRIGLYYLPRIPNTRKILLLLLKRDSKIVPRIL